VTIRYREPGKPYRTNVNYDGSGGSFNGSQSLLVLSCIGEALTAYDEVGLTYNDSFYTYDGNFTGTARKTVRTVRVKASIRNTVSRSLSVGANIYRRFEQTITAKASVRNTVTQSFQGKAYIITQKQIMLRGRIIPTISLKARLSRQQGGIAPGHEDPGYMLWTDTSLNTKANLYHYIGYPTYTVQSKGRVLPIRTNKLDTRVRIVGGQVIGAKAYIRPLWSYCHVPMSFRVSQMARQRATMIFYTEGRVTTPTVTTKAYIAKRMSARVTGHFLVAMTPTVAGVMHVDNPTTKAKTLSLLSMRAYIAR